MKISKAFAIVQDLRLAVQAAFMPTLRAVLRSPLLVFRPSEVSRIFMSYVWKAFGDGVDQGGRPVKEELIRANARGVVLDIGAGHGHTVLYLDRAAVTQYVALEPNTLMHPHIRALAAAHGFTEADGTLFVLPYGAEETALIRSALSTLGDGRVDTLISVLTLCSVPAPERTLHALVADVLRPGGALLFYEHVLSPRADVAWWQRFWTPVWRRAFDGCCLDRPTHVWIEKMDAWKDGEGRVWGKEGEEEEHLFWHRTGRFVKKDGEAA